MQGPVLARDIMVKDLVTLKPQMDVFEAIERLLKHKISGACVVDDEGQFLGVFTEKDCLSVLVNAAYDRLPTTRIRAFISTEVRTVNEETDVLTISQIFLNTPYRRLPVLTDGSLVGQISRRDVLRAVNLMDRPSGERGGQLLYLSSLIALEDAPIV